MAQKKGKSIDLAVFKGREAKLNRAIFKILSDEASLTIWDITKRVNKKKGFKHTRYAVVNTRVRILEEKGYLGEASKKQTKTGGVAILYEATSKAIFALLLDSLDMDVLIQELDEIGTLTILATIVSR